MNSPRGSFQFQNMWLHHEALRGVILESWSNSVYGDPFFILLSKLNRQKTRLRVWYREVKQRCRKKAIVGTLIDGDWITDKDQVVDSVVDYFHSAFANTMAHPSMADLEDCIPNLVSSQDNENLMAPPPMQEDIVGVEVFNAVRYFMDGATLPRGLTSTVLTLLPKCEGSRLESSIDLSVYVPLPTK
ncbi:hypothetical protein LIER_22597 [Lithospermum erythrorhizon]|uniref:Uncharacterized protein n=1 Tax=Lithospermum erythrorhizon TaxID=34254 RepID=A0AAV3QXI2_LITER